MRRQAHAVFDQLWKRGKRSVKGRKTRSKLGDPPWNRNDAYFWLAKRLGMRREYVHMMLFDERQCERVIEIVTTEFPWTKKGIG